LAIIANFSFSPISHKIHQKQNNPHSAPNSITVDLSELKSLRLKNLTLKGGKGEHVKYPPKAFTEKGLYMLATILKSEQATQTTLAIMNLKHTVRRKRKADN